MSLSQVFDKSAGRINRAQSVLFTGKIDDEHTTNAYNSKPGIH